MGQVCCTELKTLNNRDMAHILQRHLPAEVSEGHFELFSSGPEANLLDLRRVLQTHHQLCVLACRHKLKQRKFSIVLSRWDFVVFVCFYHEGDQILELVAHRECGFSISGGGFEQPDLIKPGLSRH